MDVVFLGYMDLDFEASDHSHIDGIKFFYYFPSDSRNYVGFEVASYFVPRNKPDLINQVRSCVPGQPAILDMGFNGKRAVFNGITMA